MQPHPAKFSDPILQRITALVPEGARVLDPFAGVGLVHQLPCDTWGIELEPEWATQHPRTIIGNALHLPFADASWPWVVTSPTYANRMADCHNAKDGSRRITYKHYLGRDLHPDNSGQLQWGPKYRIFHVRAWRQVFRILEDEGHFLLNIKNHIRNHAVTRVAEWHVTTLIRMGFELEALEVIPVDGMRFGENHEARIDHELVGVFRRPARSKAPIEHAYPSDSPSNGRTRGGTGEHRGQLRTPRTAKPVGPVRISVGNAGTVTGSSHE